MINTAKLVDWYYRADYTFFWRKKYEVMLGSIDNSSMAQIQKVIRGITRKAGIYIPVTESLYWAGQGRKIETINHKYLDRIQQIEPETLSWRQWDSLRFLLCSKGLFQMSHICRNNAVERLISSNGAYGILRRFAYAVENGYYTEADELVHSKKFLLLKIFGKERYEQCKDICATLSGEKKTEDAFGEYIAHKRVVILGPAQHDKGYLDYGKEKDVIVRFAYRGKEYLPACDKEIPTDISCYNGEFEAYEEQNELKNFKQDLKFAAYKRIPVSQSLPLFYTHALKSAHYKRMALKEDRQNFPGERNMYILEPGVMFGQANMVPNAIFDCMHYETECIYVRNCNLYMAKKCYAKDYSIRNSDPKRLLYAFAKHDYEGQFNLLKALYKAGKFECDEECKNVLSLSADEYIKNMEIIYTGQ